MPRKSKSLIKIEELIACKLTVREDIRSQMNTLGAQLDAIGSSIAEMEVLAADLQPKPRKAKNPLGVERIENQPK